MILQKLRKPIESKNFLLSRKDSKYFLNIVVQDSKFYIQLTRKRQIGLLLSNLFQTLTGGIVYYNYKNSFKYNYTNKNIIYKTQNNTKNKYKSTISYRTIIWLGEEIHQVNCEPNILFVEHGDLILRESELIPGLFSKTSGIIFIQQKNNLIQTISIKSGLVYKGKKFKPNSKKIYFPGEVIFSNIRIKQLSFCEHITWKKSYQLLIRPLEIYEFAYVNSNNINIRNDLNKNSNIKLNCESIYSYKSGQKINGTKNLNLVSQFLTFQLNKFLNRNLNIELQNNQNTKSIDYV